VTARREVWITGVGLLTCLGEGLESVWSHLERGDPPPYDDKSFAPYVVHPLASMSFDKQIPKKSDQRQMETWQRVGVYTAGLALSDAGIAGKPDLLDHTDMIIDAGGGERDIAVDTAILSGMRKVAQPAAFLNERLMRDLRPTLFLAQLPNLLAGNISLVHGVVGSSRTFTLGRSLLIRAHELGTQGQICACLGSRSAGRHRVCDHGRLPGPRKPRACAGARRAGARSPVGGSRRPQSPPARRNRSDAAQRMGGDRRQGRSPACGRDFRRGGP